MDSLKNFHEGCGKIALYFFALIINTTVYRVFAVSALLSIAEVAHGQGWVIKVENMNFCGSNPVLRYKSRSVVLTVTGTGLNQTASGILTGTDATDGALEGNRGIFLQSSTGISEVVFNTGVDFSTNCYNSFGGDWGCFRWGDIWIFSRLKINSLLLNGVTPTSFVATNPSDVITLLANCTHIVQVSNSATASNWVNITSPITGNNLPLFSGSRFGRRYFRISDPQYPNQRNSEIQTVIFWAPVPQVTVSRMDPLCRDGKGSVTATINHAEVTINRFTARLQKKNGSLWSSVISQGNVTVNRTGTNAGSCTFSELDPGIYRVIATNNSQTDILGASEAPSAEIEIRNPSSIQIAISSVPVICKGASTGQAIPVITGGAGGYKNYEWRKATESTPLSNLNTLSGIPAGTYTLSVQDANNCMGLGSVVIGEPQFPISVDLVNSNETTYRGAGISCPGSNDGEIKAAVSNSTANPITYIWYDDTSSPAITSGLSSVLSMLAAGSYYVIVSDGNGCTNFSNRISLVSPAPIEFSIDQIGTLVCPEDKIVLQAKSIRNEFGNVTYQWSNGERGESIEAGPGTYSLYIQDELNCSSTASKVIDTVPIRTVVLQETTSGLYHNSLVSCNDRQDGAFLAEVRDESGGRVRAENYAWYKDGIRIFPTDAPDSLYGIGRGNYRVEITYNNGQCGTEATRFLNDPSPVVVDIVARTDQSIRCSGTSDAVLHAVATGGILGGYTYSWNTGSTDQFITAAYADRMYTVVVKDINNCMGMDSLLLENPAPLPLDLGGGITLCTGQTHMLDAGPGWRSYAWGSSVEDFSASGQQCVLREPGMYWLEVVNEENCVARDTFLLQTSLELLRASFMVPAEAHAGDTIVMIDISWPLPEGVEWTFPGQMKKILEQENILFGQFENPGQYEIGLTTYLGECVDHEAKTITILEAGSVSETTRLGYEKFVKELALHPNPTDGTFSVTVELLEESPVILSIWSTPAGHLIEKVQQDGNTTYTIPFNLLPVTPGTYLLRLDHTHGTNYIRFVVQ